MQTTVVINIVGLTKQLIGKHTPVIQKFCDQGSQHTLQPTTPAVTCSVQASFMTGSQPSEHGCVANGWYFRDLAQVWFWRQSHHLVGGENIWEAAKKKNPDFRCAQLFWWYNMYSGADYSITPRPIYAADGRKISDVYSEPYFLRDQLNQALGMFPLFNFWGPMANIASSQWIADASCYTYEQYQPTLSLIYLPHLDYNLQRLGPEHPDIEKDLREIDAVVGQLLRYFENKGARIILLSEYGIHPVSKSIAVNRILRKEGWIRYREELGREMLDPGASAAFAVADHQIAHVYIQDQKLIPKVRDCLKAHPDIELILGQSEQSSLGLNHERSGELVLLSKPDAWFNYYYWFDDDRAPDYARTVAIHDKPGYDPVELFLDPEYRFPKAQVAWRLAKKKLGFRSLMDVIPLDPSLVKGSHGYALEQGLQDPIFITSEKDKIPQETLHATDVKAAVLSHIFDDITL